jgi:hypothetical protein
MEDVYQELSALGRERDEVSEQEAKLKAHREKIEARIRELAARLVAGSGEQTRRTESDGEELAPRYRKLLSVLRNYPAGQEVSHLARMIYGNDAKTSRINVSSDFSRLRTLGYVDPIHRGTFKITEKGLRALNGGRH